MKTRIPQPLLSVLLWSWAALQAQNPMFISSIDKSSAPPGAVLTISGRNFGTSTSNIRVFFGGAVAAPQSVIDGLIEVEVPAGATFDNVSVLNTSTKLSASSSEFFTLAFGPSEDFSKDFFTSTDVELSDTTLTMGNVPKPFYNLCTCDFDGDGKMDIAGAAADSRSDDAVPGITAISVFQNTTATIGGEPSFSDPIRVPTGSPVRQIVCGDLDNDGLSDLVATQASTGGTSERNKLFYMKNTSTGGSVSFEAAQEKSIPDIGTGGVRVIGRVAIRDLDADGKADIVVLNQDDNHVFIFSNNSSGTSISFEETPLDIQGTDTEGDRLWGLDVKDLNKDGLPEIVVGKINKAVFMLQNKSTPGDISFSTSKMLAEPTDGSIRNIAIADLNDDGKNDIICSSNDANRVLWLTNQTPDKAGSEVDFHGTFEQTSVDNTPWGLDLGDVDGDGRLDILLSTIGGDGPYLLRNTSPPGTGMVSFEANDLGDETKTDPKDQRRSRNVRIADVNQDGKPDLLLANADVKVNADNSTPDDSKLKIFVISNTHCMKPSVDPFIMMPDERVLCDGVPFEVEATPAPGVTYTWAADPAAETGITGQTIDLRDLLKADGGYNITVTASIGTADPSRSCDVVSEPSGPFRRLEGSVDQASLSVTSGGMGNSACAGEEVTITAALPGTPDIIGHFWTGPGGTEYDAGLAWALPDISSAQAGKYEYYYTASVSGNTCPSEKTSLTLEVQNLPVIAIRSDSPYGCSNEAFSVMLESASHPTVTMWQWKLNGIEKVGAEESAYTALEAGDYILNYGDGTCSRDTPVLSISGVDPPGSTSSSNVILTTATPWCKDVLYGPQLDATPAPTAQEEGLQTLIYAWDLDEGGATSTISTEASPVHIYTAIGSYTISVTVSYEEAPGCSSSARGPIEVIEPPSIKLVRNPDRDEKCPATKVRITAPSVSDEGTNLLSYTWDSGETTNSITNRDPGTYTVTAIDDAGCTIMASASFTNIPNSGIGLKAGALPEVKNDTLRIENLEEEKSVEVAVTQLKNGTEGIISWSRVGALKQNTPEYIKQLHDKGQYFIDVLDTTVRHRPIITAYYDEFSQGPLLYRILASDQVDCPSDAYIEVSINPSKSLEGFNMFTPNADGMLDRWNIYKLDLIATGGVTCKVQIFDRRGSLVFTKDDVGGSWTGWDGKNNGKDLTEDVYFYIVECDCKGEGCPVKGSGSLLLVRR